MPLWMVLYSTLVKCLEIFLYRAPMVAGLASLIPFAYASLSHTLLLALGYIPLDEAYKVSTFCAVLFLVCILGQLVTLPIRFGLMIGSKWLLVGQRQVGAYPWHESTYLIRWKLFGPLLAATWGTQTPATWGSAYIVACMRALGCQIGRDVCLFPQGHDLMPPEPDLVTIGDRVCVNRSSIVCHVNVLGQFGLGGRINIRRDATLRSWTRVMGGATVSADARLREHTLLLPGEDMTDGEEKQGWPPIL